MIHESWKYTVRRYWRDFSEYACSGTGHCSSGEGHSSSTSQSSLTSTMGDERGAAERSARLRRGAGARPEESARQAVVKARCSIGSSLV